MSESTAESVVGTAGVGSIATEGLRSLVDAQARIVELIASRSPVEETLFSIARELEAAWPGIDVGFLMSDEESGHNTTTALDLAAPLADALREVPAASLLDSVDTDDPSAPTLLDLTAATAWATDLREAMATASMEAAWLSLVTPVDDPTPSWMVIFVTGHNVLAEGERALIRRFAHLARLAIDQHRAELQLHRLIADERRRLAGVIHDDPIQALTAVGLRIQRLARHVEGDSATQVAELHVAVGTAIERMRRLLIDLHPPTLDDDGLVSAIDVYLGEVLEPLGIECSLDDTVDEEPAPETASLAYRLAAEALWNVAKHAEASRVDVRVRIEAGTVEIQVSDDGKGFDTTTVQRRRAGHMGISACRELASRASGSWTVQSAVGAGTTVTLWLPGAAPIDATESS